MDPRALSEHEVAALVALLQRAVMADQKITPPERSYVLALSKQFEPGLYARALEAANKRLPEGDDGLVALVDEVVRQEARQLIYDLVVQTLAVDGIVPEELLMLGWLEERWSIARPDAVDEGGFLDE